MTEMTIKRRIFLSNILMIVIPVFLSAIGLLMYLTILHLITERHHETAEGRRGRSEARSLVRSWSKDVSLSEMISDLEDFNTRYSNNVRLTLYENGEQIFPVSAFSLEPSYSSMTNSFYTFRKPEGYQVVLTRTETRFSVLRVGFEARNFVIATGIVIFIIFTAVVVILTNRFLNRFVFNIINVSLDNLRYGAGQIRDGNLSYRLDTNKENEFDAVSADFNEMAFRLQDYVNSRLQDETTRKELIAGISHDIRTPLTGIRAYIEGFENGLDSTTQIRSRYIQTIKNKLCDLEQITDTLFLFSSLELNEFPWRIEKTDLLREFGHLVSDLKEEYESRGLSITLLAENGKEINANIDFRQMRNAVINILENSVKYKDKEHGKMEINLSHDKASAFITMTDDGSGVPDESLGRLFEIFYRVDSSRSETIKGNGLGLAMVAKIVNSFGGIIRAKNSSSGGLSIIIQIPLAEVI